MQYRLELYRIDRDPYEVHDLAADPENQALVEKLHARLKEIMTQAGESLEPKRASRKNERDGDPEKGSKKKRRKREKP